MKRQVERAEGRGVKTVGARLSKRQESNSLLFENSLTEINDSNFGKFEGCLVSPLQKAPKYSLKPLSVPPRNLSYSTLVYCNQDLFLNLSLFNQVLLFVLCYSIITKYSLVARR